MLPLTHKQYADLCPPRKIVQWDEINIFLARGLVVLIEEENGFATTPMGELAKRIYEVFIGIKQIEEIRL